MKKKHVPFFEAQLDNKIDSINESKSDDDVQNDLFKMANFRKPETGLPMIIWVCEMKFNNIPLIEVSKGYYDKFMPGDTFSVSILNPKIIAGDQGAIKDSDLNLVIQGIKLNEEVLMKYWNWEISTTEMANALKKLT